MGIAVSCNIGAAFLIAVIVLAIKCFRGNSSYVDKKVKKLTKSSILGNGMILKQDAANWLHPVVLSY